MSERKGKYQASEETESKRLVTVTLTVEEWARVAFACQSMARQGLGAVYGEMCRCITRRVTEGLAEEADNDHAS